MSSSRRRDLVNLVGFGAATVLGLSSMAGISKFNSTYGPVIAELEGIETSSAMITDGGSVRANQVAKNLGYNSEEEREQKLRNVSLGSAGLLARDGARYEQLNSDPWLNDVVYPLDRLINYRFDSPATEIPAKFPRGYVVAGILTGLAAFGLVQNVRSLRRRL